MNLNKLRTISKTPTGRLIFDFLATYKRQTWETRVEDLKNYIVNQQLKIEETLDAMADAGAGEFIVGRRGGVTRMKWEVPITDMVKQVRRQSQGEEEGEEEETTKKASAPNTKALEDILKMTNEIPALANRVTQVEEALAKISMQQPN
jgi:hypothetical protein